MKKHIIDETNGFSYTLHGDYYLPDLVLPPETDSRPIGMWGLMHKRYLMEHRKALFTHLAMSNKLHTYLADIDEQAFEMFDSIVKDMKKAEDVTEQLTVKSVKLRINILKQRTEKLLIFNNDTAFSLP